MAIAWQLRGKGGDRNAAEPEENTEIENAKLKIENAARRRLNFQFSIFNFQFADVRRRSCPA
jgi:hypothetical protein